MGSLAVVTAPAGEPVTLSEVKLWSRITSTYDDDLLSGLITSARQHFDGREPWIGRALLTQTWDYFLNEFPVWDLCIPLPPLQSITTLKYTDTVGVQQTLASTEYTVDIKSTPGRVVPAFGKFWPSTQCDTPNAVEIRFVAGYGALAAAVPAEIRSWIKQAAGFLYENREAPQLPPAFLWQMAKYKVDWKF